MKAPPVSKCVQCPGQSLVANSKLSNRINRLVELLKLSQIRSVCYVSFHNKYEQLHLNNSNSRISKFQ